MLLKNVFWFVSFLSFLPFFFVCFSSAVCDNPTSKNDNNCFFPSSFDFSVMATTNEHKRKERKMNNNELSTFKFLDGVALKKAGLD